MHFSTPPNQPIPSALYSAAPTVSREGTNGLLISGLPISENSRIERSILDRILLTYKKYLCDGSPKAKLKHEAGDFSDGGHYVMPMSYSYAFTKNYASNTADLHIDFWVSSTPVPYISAGVPLPEATSLDDDAFDKWTDSLARKQVQDLAKHPMFNNGNTVNVGSTTNHELTDDDIEWRDRFRTRVAVKQAKIDHGEPKVPESYRPMVVQEVTQIFDGYLEAIKAELEIFLHGVHQSAAASQTEPDYFQHQYDHLPAFYPNLSPCQ